MIDPALLYLFSHLVAVIAAEGRSAWCCGFCCFLILMSCHCVKAPLLTLQRQQLRISGNKTSFCYFYSTVETVLSYFHLSRLSTPTHLSSELLHTSFSQTKIFLQESLEQGKSQRYTVRQIITQAIPSSFKQSS